MGLATLALLKLVQCPPDKAIVLRADLLVYFLHALSDILLVKHYRLLVRKGDALFDELVALPVLAEVLGLIELLPIGSRSLRYEAYLLEELCHQFGLLKQLLLSLGNLAHILIRRYDRQRLVPDLVDELLRPLKEVRVAHAVQMAVPALGELHTLEAAELIPRVELHALMRPIAHPHHVQVRLLDDRVLISQPHNQADVVDDSLALAGQRSAFLLGHAKNDVAELCLLEH